jgi:hypothetical protein
MVHRCGGEGSIRGLESHLFSSARSGPASMTSKFRDDGGDCRLEQCDGRGHDEVGIERAAQQRRLRGSESSVGQRRREMSRTSRSAAGELRRASTA